MNRHLPPSGGGGRGYSGPIAWMAQHSIAVNLLMVLLIGGGIWAAFNIQKEVFPEFPTSRTGSSCATTPARRCATRRFGEPRSRCLPASRFGRARPTSGGCPPRRRTEGSTRTAAEFAIAPAELRAEAEALRPSHSAPLSSSIAYAAWLDQMDLRDKARKYWREASQQRPDDPVLRRLAAQ